MAPRKTVTAAGDKPKDVLAAVLLADSFTQVRRTSRAFPLCRYQLVPLFCVNINSLLVFNVEDNKSLRVYAVDAESGRSGSGPSRYVAVPLGPCQ